ncbi:MAG: PHP domain-containing protein [Planctomycetes bacterium]|nr:PHP domain-containing protein [Planctomycetota bacterium]
MKKTVLVAATAVLAAAGVVSCKDPIGVPGPCQHRKVVFQGAAYAGNFRAYFGNLHAHTGYSDGAADPRSAFAYARDVAGLDFLAVTDHHEFVSDEALADTIRQALAESRPGRFVALAGFEWSHGFDRANGRLYNHINVFGTPRTMPKLEASDLAGFYCHLLALPDGAFGQFNHPSYRKPPLETNHWDDYKYDAYVDARMTLFEAGKGDYAAEKGYIKALEAGWHVSPVSNQDNHHADWGTANSSRAGVWAEGLSLVAVLKALREMRTFSTTDGNATIRLMAEGRYWMGSVLKRAGAVPLRVEAFDPDPGEAFVKVELFAKGGKPIEVLTVRSPGRLTRDWTVNPTGSGYYFARITQADGDELLSAPIWIER